jgi:hypothetical protein
LADIWWTRDHLGRAVVLTPAGRDHIRVRHPDFANRIGEINAVVEHPDFVNRDRIHTHRECFYQREGSNSGYIKTVVHYRPVAPQGTWEGEIITAYHVEEAEVEETKLWP